MKQQIIIIRNQLSDISSQLEEKKNTLFSIFTVLLLSKEIFKRNDDLRPFLKQCNIEYANYVYRSRTMLMARTLREINIATPEQLNVFIRSAKQILTSQSQNDNRNIKVNKPNNQKSHNPVDDLLERYGR